tara:strand:+ start:5753 stop:6718 length:966 start_codon:yes stop_codon:yes gene_type:complete
MAELFLYEKDDKEFKDKLKLIKKSINILCKKAIHSDYIDIDSNKYSNLIIAFSKGSDRNQNDFTTILGFVVLCQNKEDVIEVELICVGNQFRDKQLFEAKGLGYKLFSKIDELCLNKNISIVKLSALPYVINYYRKMGFKHISDPKCNGKDKEDKDLKKLAQYFYKNKFESDFQVEMFMRIDKIIKLHSEIKNKKKIITNLKSLEYDILSLLNSFELTLKEKKMYIHYFKLSKRTYGSDKILDFIEKLVELGFSKECDKIKNVFRNRSLLNTELNPICCNEGFIMTKCFNNNDKKSKRCPNGTRRNKSTKICEKHNITKKI